MLGGRESMSAKPRVPFWLRRHLLAEDVLQYLQKAERMSGGWECYLVFGDGTEFDSFIQYGWELPERQTPKIVILTEHAFARRMSNLSTFPDSYHKALRVRVINCFFERGSGETFLAFSLFENVLRLPWQ
jgi:hypothetical protein